MKELFYLSWHWGG